MSENNISASYEQMLKAGMHFGRRRTVFNPKMGKYVFTIRNGICIIDLLKTRSELEIAAGVLKNTIKNGGLVLFVGLTKQSAEAMKNLAIKMNMPYAINRWIGGTLTNYKVISNRVNLLDTMEKQLASNSLDKYTKKERLMFERKLNKMRESFDGLRKLNRIPDVIFVSSLKESATPIREARSLGAKVVAIANTDANPDQVDCVIPANDRSKKSVDVVLDLIEKELTE
jgi:small subunit ribosomal protein S2